MNKNVLVLAASSSLALTGCQQNETEIGQSLPSSVNQSQTEVLADHVAQPNINIWPKLDISVKRDPAVENRVTAIMSEMTLEQKVAQMIQPEIRDITVEDMRRYGFGSYLYGGGSFPDNNKHATPADWIRLAEDMYQASVDDSLDGIRIPTMWGTDAVHGHNNVIGATLFPHNIGLGAANNPDLIEKIASVTATEVMVTGIDWVFAPTVATVRDDRWGRTYEGYSEDPNIVKAYSTAIVNGLQGHAGDDFLSANRVISTVKHFVGDGGTVGGDDQGDNIASEQELFDIHAQGYVGGLTAGAQSVMASFNSWHGKKIHGSKYLLTDVLKDRMGFDGFVVGDWNGHGQVAGCSNENCPAAVNAGLDIFMVPTQAWKPLYENLLTQVKDGTVAMSRIDDAVRRILRVKVRAGLFEKPGPANRQYSGKTELIGSKAHREVARQAVRESLVLLKNNEQLLPLNPKQHILLAGDGANNIGKQSGGWTITWQGTNNTNAEFPGGSSIYDGFKQQVEAAGGTVSLSEDGSFAEKPDVAVVVFGEDPYAEGHGDRENLEYQRGNKTDLTLLKKLKAAGIPVVSVFISGRPLWVNPELNASDAFVAAWLPGSEGNGVADVLLSKPDGNVRFDFKGKLSFSWPKSPMQVILNVGEEGYDPLLPYGFGLRYGEADFFGNKLDEASNVPVKLSDRKLFSGTMHKPWLLNMIADTQQHEVQASTLALSGLSYRTIDRNVQEDAFRVQVDGSASEAGVRITSKSMFREDLLSEKDAESAIEFSYILYSKPVGRVSLAMQCDETEGPCRAELDITDAMTGAELNTWHEMSVDLTCFTQRGVDMSKIVIPFELKGTAQLDIGLSDIMFKAGKGPEASIQCDVH